jgi:two-component system, NarL family, nitrate/nitrite response regulator NarL
MQIFFRMYEKFAACCYAFGLFDPNCCARLNRLGPNATLFRAGDKMHEFIALKQDGPIMRLQSSPSLSPVQSIRILIADRNRMGNQLLAESLGRDPRFEVVAAAAPKEILSVVTNLQPDLALISADFDGATKKGLQIARTLSSRNPSVGIVILLETSTQESVVAAFRCGAAGVFSRTESLAELARCIEHVSRGEIGANKHHSQFLLEALRSTPSCEGIGAGKIDRLSPRELQVAEHAAQGESNKQIADRLGLSEHTVKNYLFHVFEKLGVSNRFELLFLLFKECNSAAPDRTSLTLALETGHPIETYLIAAEEGSAAAQFVVGLAHLEGYCVEKNGLSAYYWLRLAEASSRELGHRSRALLEQLRNGVEAHQIEDVEQRISIAVKNNKLFQSQRPVEFIKRSADPLALNIAI